MKNSKKGVLYAIMAVVGLSGVSARADLKSSFRTATARARDWAGKHKKGIGIGLGALAGAAALSAGTYYGGKTYKQRQAVRPTFKQRQAVRPTLTLSEKNISETLVPTTMVAIPDAQEAQAAEPAAEPAAIPPAAIPPAAEPAAIPPAAIPPAAAISDAPPAKVADNNRLALLAEIQAGRKLKSVERSKQPKKDLAAEPAAIPQAAAIPPAAAAISGVPGAKVADNNRLALLAEIQAGRNLKSVERSKQPKKNREAPIFGLMDESTHLATIKQLIPQRRGALGYPKDDDYDNEDDQNDSWSTD